MQSHRLFDRCRPYVQQVWWTRREPRPVIEESPTFNVRPPAPADNRRIRWFPGRTLISSSLSHSDTPLPRIIRVPSRNERGVGEISGDAVPL